MLGKPTIVNENGKYKLVYAVGVDANNDGQMSVSASIVVELDQKEALEEAAAKILAGSNLPQWLKDIIGAK